MFGAGSVPQGGGPSRVDLKRVFTNGVNFNMEAQEALWI
jgi:hypothetical protein